MVFLHLKQCPHFCNVCAYNVTADQQLFWHPQMNENSGIRRQERGNTI